MEVIENLIRQTAFFQDGIDWRNYVMILVAFIFLYLAIKKGYEPLTANCVWYALGKYLSADYSGWWTVKLLL